MPRPRFQKLSAEKQARILDVASEEFAEHGFEGASYNRIIERAGLSKGAMYYYFDDKTDLYGTVLQDTFQEIMAELRPPRAEDPESFWRGLHLDYVRTTRLALERPRLVALSRGLMDHPERWKQGPVAEIFQAMIAYTEALIDVGRAIGAVREDLDRSLLVAATFALGEAVDRWNLDHLDELRDRDIDELCAQLVGLYRRLLQP